MATGSGVLAGGGFPDVDVLEVLPRPFRLPREFDRPWARPRRRLRLGRRGEGQGPITASYVNKETDRTQARRARDRPPGHVYFSALGVTCQLDVLPSPSPSTSSPRVVPAVRPFDPDVPDAVEPWGGHLRPSG